MSQLRDRFVAMTRLSPKLFAFLRDLAANNNREWFQANRDRYVDDVQEPALEFIAAFADRLAAISPHLVADARVVGGSLFRIHRDTRFSKDKTPYKENTGMRFMHESIRDVHAPGLYVHLQPNGSFAGVGLWRPETVVAYRIRHQIADDPEGWKMASAGTAFSEVWAQSGDSLVRPPKGFDPDHPLIVDLKRKDFASTARLTEKQITSAGFIDELTEMCSLATPYMRFLCRAVGVQY